MKPTTISLILDRQELSDLFRLVNDGKGYAHYKFRNTIQKWLDSWREEYRNKTEKWCIVFDRNDIDIIYEVLLNIPNTHRQSLRIIVLSLSEAINGYSVYR